MQELSTLIQRLLAAKFDFVIVGGFAGVLHGSSLVTHDLDICAAINPATIKQLRAILAEANPRHRMDQQRRSFLEYPADNEPINNLYLATNCGVLDILSSIKGVGDFARVRRDSVAMPILGHPCRVISLQDLIQGKEALGREKDLLTAKELRAIAAKHKGT